MSAEGRLGNGGAAASPHSTATLAGADVLASGGNALDACLAMNAVLTVVYPHMCGLGGDLFLLSYEAKAQRLHCLNASGRAPALATREAFRARGLNTVPARGPLSASVPGVVAGWAAANKRFGTWNFADLLAPAIAVAESGVTVTERLAAWISSTAEDLKEDPALRRWFFDTEGLPHRAGAVLRFPELAETLGRIATVGPDDFYSGEIARKIDRSSRNARAFLRFEDLQSHRCEWTSPLQTNYRDVQVFTTPPNSQGITALQMLNLLTSLGAHRFTPGSAQYVDALVTAKQLAFADRDRYVSDPEFVEIPVLRLLSPEHARKSLLEPAYKVGGHATGGDTVYVCAVDPAGNACSLIQSIYYAFGSAFVADDTGIVLQNRAHYFSLEDWHPNRLEPGKRTLHTLMASMAFRKGRPWLVFGTMGADGQPQTTVQVLEWILAGVHPQEAVAAPRVLSGRFFVEDEQDRLLVEESLGVETIEELETLGHTVELAPADDERMGHAHAVLIGDGGRLLAGSDPRSDGQALY